MLTGSQRPKLDNTEGNKYNIIFVICDQIFINPFT